MQVGSMGTKKPVTSLSMQANRTEFAAAYLAISKATIQICNIQMMLIIQMIAYRISTSRVRP
jgi:hypothetical protein